MTKDYETFIALYQKSSDEVKSLIDSELIGEFVDEIIKKHSLDAEKKQILISAIADLVLDINLDIENILAEAGLNQSQVLPVAKELEVFLAENLNRQSIERVTEPDESIESNNFSKSSKINELKEAADSLPTIRSMQNDVDANRGGGTTHYNTNQEDLLRRK